MQVMHDKAISQQPPLDQTWEPMAIDLTAWPVIVIRYPTVPTLEAVDDYCDRLMELFTRGEAGGQRLATVVDLRRLSASQTSSKVRAHLANRLDAIIAAHPATMACDALISESAVVRGLVTAVYWLRPNSRYPFRCFDRPDQALAWAREMTGSA